MRYISVVSKTITLFLVLLLFSCASRKEVVYYQNIDSAVASEQTNSYEVTIQPDDLLMITVFGEDPEIALPFNLKSPTVSATADSQKALNYLVDVNGTINFPVLGTLKVSGLTRSALVTLLEEKIKAYIKNPIINLQITNFKISVQGEVNAPGTYPVVSNRITLIEALTMARDLTIYGKRNNILIIREKEGVKTFNRVDISKAEFINSPFYYLSQNDVVYVEPNKSKIAGAGIGPSTGLIFSVTSLLIAVITLVIRL